MLCSFDFIYNMAGTFINLFWQVRSDPKLMIG
jgi:hypothetical protein